MIESHYVPGTDYKIYSDRNDFSFGIDGILISHYCEVKKDDKVIDIGAGSGIISLRIMAIKKPEMVYGIELQEKVAKLFSKSVLENGLDDKIQVINKNLLDCYDDFKNGDIDVIVTNPPYVKRGKGILNQEDNHLISRYELKMKLEDIFDFANKKLKVMGRLFIIHRPERLVDLMEMGRKYGLEPKEMIPVHSKINKSPKMIMMKFVKRGKENFKYEQPLIIYDDNGNYTEKVMEIYYGKR